MKSPFLSERLRAVPRRPRVLLTGGLVLVLVLAAFLLLRGGAVGGALSGDAVGYIDWARIQAEYLQPRLQEPLTELSQLQSDLQEEFDEKSKEMDDKEKQALFEEYQGRLDEKSRSVKELEARYVKEVLEATGAQASRRGVELVLQKEAVVRGGVDLTPDVLQALGARK